MKLLILIILFLIADSYAQQTFNSVRVKDLRLPSESTSRALLIDGSGQVKASSSVSDTELSYLDGLSASLTSLLSGKEPTITGGTVGQYWRGDKTFQTLDKTAVGLSNVDNTSDATKNSASASLTNKTIDADLNTITNIENADIKTGAAIDAAKINTGAVSNTEFNYVDGVTSAIQTQLNGKVGTTGNESISGNKTFTGKLITSTTSNGSIPCPVMTQAQRDAIVSPVEGDCVFNSTSDKVNVYSGTAWVAVGSGVGGINYITNFDFEIDASGWSVYADAAGTSPVDGIGGSASITFARTTSTPLRDTASGLLTKTAVNEQGEGFSVDFTVARADAFNLLDVSFEYEVVSGTYASGEIGVYIYDVTNATLIRPLIVDLPSKVNAGTPFKTQFQGTGSTSYRLIFHIATTSASAYSIEFDTIYVSPSQSFVGSIVTDWQSYTPTFTGFGTVSTQTFQWRRVGSNIEISGRFTAGTPTATEARVSLPSGINSASNYVTLEAVGITSANNVNQAVATLIEPSVNYVTFGIDNSSSAQLTKYNGNAMVGIGGFVSVNASVRVQGWSATSSAGGAIGVTPSFRATISADQLVSSTAATKINFNTVAHDNVGGFSTANNRYTIPETGLYTISGQIWVVSLTANDATTLELYVNGSGVAYNQIVNSNANYGINLVNTLQLNKGDYIELFVNSTSDTSYSIEGTASGRSWFTATRVDKNMFSMVSPLSVATISDVKSSGTNGGGSTATTWSTRTLNTLNDPTYIGVSLSSNQFTLPAGEYYIEASAPSFQSNVHKIRLRNITDSTSPLIGSSEYSNSAAAYAQTISFLSGRISITASKTFEIQHYVGASKATDGFGIAISSGESEVYTQVKITKIR